MRMATTLNFPGVSGPDRVRLDDEQRPFQGHIFSF
jgi:hypothetical protein